MKNQDWLVEIAKEIPWSVAFLVASYFFFASENKEVGWVCIVVAVATLFLRIKWVYYERIISVQNDQIKEYNSNFNKYNNNTMNNTMKMHDIITGRYAKETNSTDNE